MTKSFIRSEKGGAMTLADFTSPLLIIPRLRSEDIASVVHELSHAMHREGRIPDLLPFYEAALNREYLVSTNTEAGMAFPHARLANLKQVSFALGRSEQALAWGLKSPPSVRLVFLLAAPATDSTQYLPLISGLVRLAKDEKLLESMLAEANADELFKALQQVQLRIRVNGRAAMPVPTTI